MIPGIRRFMTAVLTAVLLCSLAPGAAAQGIVFEVKAGQAAPGGTVDITISIKENPGGFAAGILDLSFNYMLLSLVYSDDQLTNHQQSTVMRLNTSYGVGVCRIAFAGGRNIMGTGDLATLRFDVSRDARIGRSLGLGLDVVEIAVFDANSPDELNPFVKNPSVGEPVVPDAVVLDIILGDVDGSGDVTETDAIWVMEATVGKRVLEGSALLAADADNSGGITMTDAVWILQTSMDKRVLK